MATNRVSLNPATFSTGLIDDIDAQITQAQFCYWDYNKGGEQYLFLGIALQDRDGKEHLQYYSAGDKEFFSPSENGSYLVAKGNRPALSGSTNCAAFLKSLVEAKFPQERLDTMGIGEALIGTWAHWNQVDQPKRKGLIKTGQQADSDREKSTLLVSAILSLPGAVAATPKLGLGAAGQGQAPPPPPRPPMAAPTTLPVPAAVGAANLGAPATSASPSNGNAELDAVCYITLMEILAENNGSIAKANLPAAGFRKLMTHPQKQAAVPRLYSVEFLSTAPGIMFDGATVKMQ